MVRKQIETEIKVGIFVSIGVVLLMVGILILGGTQNLFTRTYVYTAHFKTVDGLNPGAKVILSGVPVGIVDTIGFDTDQKSIEVKLSIIKKAASWIHKSASAEIATQGVLGDKYINIDGGNQNDPALDPGSDITPRPTKDITQFINKGDQLMLSLNGIALSLDRILQAFEADRRSETFFKGMALTAKNLAVASEKITQEVDQMKLKNTLNQLNQIVEKVNNGSGTIGALINDPSLYDDLKMLLGGVNRNKIVRNLVRKSIRDAQETEEKEKK